MRSKCHNVGFSRHLFQGPTHCYVQKNQFKSLLHVFTTQAALTLMELILRSGAPFKKNDGVFSLSTTLAYLRDFALYLFSVIDVNN